MSPFLLRLVRLEAFRRPLALVLLGVLALLGSAGVLLGLSVAEHLTATARFMLSGSAEERSLRLLPPPPPEGQRLSFERPLITEADVAFLEGLDGVDDLRLVYNVPLPATIMLRMAGGLINSDQYLALYAVAEDDVPAPLREAWTRDGPLVPLAGSPQLVTLYNLGFADRYGLPRMSGETLMQLNVRLAVGADTFKQLPGHFVVPCAFAGFSSDVPPWGVAVPKRIAERWLLRLHGEIPAAFGAITAVCRFADLDSLQRAQAAIAERGLLIARPGELAAAVTRARDAARALIVGLLVLVGALLAAGTAALCAALCAERRRALARYRVHGGRLRHLLPIFAGGLLLAAALGALLGVAVVPLALPPLAAHLDLLLLGPPDMRAMPALPTPALPGWVWLAAPLAAGTLALLAALPVVWGASRRALLEELRGG